MGGPATRATTRARFIGAAAAAFAALIPVTGSAQSEGGLYVAGNGFSFRQAAEQAIEQNPGGRRFFVLAVPPETSALTVGAAGPLAATRDRVVASNGVLYVCQRDIDNGKINASTLVPGVMAVRGWPPAGSQELPEGARYFKDEDPAKLPVSNNSLRLLRSACSY
jgi:hypothetical protein